MSDTRGRVLEQAMPHCHRPCCLYIYTENTCNQYYHAKRFKTNMPRLPVKCYPKSSAGRSLPDINLATPDMLQLLSALQTLGDANKTQELKRLTKSGVARPYLNNGRRRRDLEGLVLRSQHHLLPSTTKHHRRFGLDWFVLPSSASSPL